MRALILAAAALLLSACGGNYCPTDHSGLNPPSWNSSIPAPHHADAP